MENKFDFIVIGAGASGCVVARRLSERPANSVLLIEAGPDVQPGAEPADIADVYATSYFNRSYFWPDLKATWRSGSPARSGFPQARIFGGGGAVMGMVALRGTRADYQEWARLGASGWDWDGVLPYLRKLESDWDFSNDSHGSDGPLPIRRLPRAAWPPLARAVQSYAASAGLPFVEDMNADFRDGCGWVPMSCTRERRASSAISYLTGDVRRRENLQVITSAQVERIVFDGARAIGVKLSRTQGSQALYAREVIVCAGAVFSPALLMRSGVGAASALRPLGIEVVAERPGVGANLQNHPIAFIGMHLNRSARQDAAIRTVPAATIRYSSGLAGCPPSDLYINVQSRTSWNTLGRHIANVAPSLLRPFSRGNVTLASADVDDYPRIDFNFLDDERDALRFTQVYARAIEIVCSDAVRALGSEPFPIRFSDRLRRLNEFNRTNAFASALVAAAIDAVPALRGVVLRTLTGNHVDLRALAADPERLAAHARESVAGVFHPAGTCRMGAPGDPDAVVDPEGRVYGIAGLRVADASIMPTIPSGNTNIPAIMVGEKIAAAITAGAGSSSAA